MIIMTVQTQDTKFDYSAFILQKLREKVEQEQINTHKIPRRVACRFITQRIFKCRKRNDGGFKVTRILEQIAKDYPDQIELTKETVILH